MKTDTKKLIAALRKKREAEGLSIRALSSKIGVSFSSLARIERGEGQPDNNSTIRIIEWLGDDARAAGLSFDQAALVHFRAAKNVQSKTISCLLAAAEILKRTANVAEPSDGGSEETDSNSEPQPRKALSLSKPEMEDMARGFREQINVPADAALESLNIRISGVDVYVPDQISELGQDCRAHLDADGVTDWSAMSVPLDAAEEFWAILRNNRHSVERQRVTYLEECWHILLGHKLTRIAKVADGYGRTYDSTEEHDAYYLAAACLLPEDSVTEAVRQRKPAAEIARQFGTSPELVEYRIKRLGLWSVYKGKEIKLSAGDSV